MLGRAPGNARELPRGVADGGRGEGQRGGVVCGLQHTRCALYCTPANHCKVDVHNAVQVLLDRAEPEACTLICCCRLGPERDEGGQGSVKAPAAAVLVQVRGQPGRQAGQDAPHQVLHALQVRHRICVLPAPDHKLKCISRSHGACVV